LSQQALRQVLPQIPLSLRTNVLVDSTTHDDAGVYRLDKHRALVQTVDFFTPIVDDAFSYGQIAAANSLSDIYAMGARPLTALNIVGFPTDMISPTTISAILRGGLSKAAEAGCAIVGGHSIRNPEPIYGLAITGVVSIDKLMTNAKARSGDFLVLTKPLGTGIATTAMKRGIASRALVKNAITLMSKLNVVGATLAENGLVKAATDVTGFGLIGHLANLCRGSGLRADIDIDAVPMISKEIAELIKRDCVPGGTQQNLYSATVVTNWQSATNQQRILFTDAQTSGGLLLCVAEKNLQKVLRLLRKARTPCAAVIGRMVDSRRGPLICMTK
jgi:selenide, water dikinase